MAPVCLGTAAPSELEVVSEPPADVAAGNVVVGVVTPLVKGTPSVPVLAPEKAGAVVVAVVSGVAEALSGFRTL